MNEITCHVDSVIASLPVSQSKLSLIEAATERVTIVLSKFIKQGWPEHVRNIPECIRDFYSVKDALLIWE